MCSQKVCPLLLSFPDQEWLLNHPCHSTSHQRPPCLCAFAPQSRSYTGQNTLIRGMTTIDSLVTLAPRVSSSRISAELQRLCNYKVRFRLETKEKFNCTASHLLRLAYKQGISERQRFSSSFEGLKPFCSFDRTTLRKSAKPMNLFFPASMMLSTKREERTLPSGLASAFYTSMFQYMPDALQVKFSYCTWIHPWALCFCCLVPVFHHTQSPFLTP